jgi:hypothetical protein
MRDMLGGCGGWEELRRHTLADRLAGFVKAESAPKRLFVHRYLQ